MKQLFTKNTPVSIAVLVIFVAMIAWFTVPRALLNGMNTIKRVPKNNPAIVVSQEIREKIEKDIRETVQALKSGDKRGGENFQNHYLMLGINYETLGRYEFAEDAYKRAINEDPSKYVAYANLGSLYQARGEYTSAVSELRNAIERAPAEFGLYNRLAELYWYKTNNVELARGTFLEGIMRTNNNNNLVRSFASFLEQTGQKDEALLYWEALVKQNPQDQDLKKHYEELKGKK